MKHVKNYSSLIFGGFFSIRLHHIKKKKKTGVQSFAHLNTKTHFLGVWFINGLKLFRRVIHLCLICISHSLQMFCNDCLFTFVPLFSVLFWWISLILFNYYAHNCDCFYNTFLIISIKFIFLCLEAHCYLPIYKDQTF